MFGTLRFVLSVGVVISHLWAGLSHWSAVYAVFGFFVLSGYLMTLVLHQTYGFSAQGQLRYLTNRALRIFPVYWLVLALSLLANAAVVMPQDYPIRIFLPEGALAWLANLFIFGLDNGETKIIPPAWTLYTEFIFYIAMGLFLSRWRTGVLLWLGVSLAYSAWLVLQDSDFATRYYAVLPATLPFSLGAAVYLLLGSRNLQPPRWMVSGIFAIFTIHLFAADHLWGKAGIFREGFYVSLILAVACVAALSSLRLSGRAGRIDRFLGDISYPVFLAHWPVGALVVALTGLKSGAPLLLISLPLTIAVSMLLHRVAEVPVNRYRDAIRLGPLDARAVDMIAR